MYSKCRRIEIGVEKIVFLFACQPTMDIIYSFVVNRVSIHFSSEFNEKIYAKFGLNIFVLENVVGFIF